MSDERYSRQRALPEIGDEGQARLADSRVVVVGCGALGSLQAELLARAGIGRLTIVDRDFVERSNLQRQTLFTDADAEERLPKAVAAERALAAINPAIEVRGVVDDVNAGTAPALLGDADLVCDGTDNFETRYLVNDWSVREGVPWVYGGVIGTGGLVMPVLPGETACLRCVFETPPAPGTLPTCETAGVLGSAVAAVVGFQATEALKILLGARDRVRRALVRLDVWAGEFASIETGGPRSGCPTCDDRDFAWLEGRRGSRTARLCGRDAIQLLPRERTVPPLEAIAERLEPEWDVSRNPFMLRARRDGITLHLFADGRAIVEGTTEESEARAMYARVVGH